VICIHAWESIQKAVDFIEENLANDIEIEALARNACLSAFYFQRLFSRLVKKPVREYIKLRRLACAVTMLENSFTPITDIAIECGFGGRETFSRAFKETYGISPSLYREAPVGVSFFDKPNLLLNYTMVDEGAPLITEGIVLEFHRKTLENPVHFMGVQGIWRFEHGKMLGERPAINEPSAIWDNFHAVESEIPRIPHGRRVGVSYHGGAPAGYSTYFAGAEVEEAVLSVKETPFVRWILPPREYIVCQYEAENFTLLMASLGKMMKFTRYWLKAHGLRADGFFPEIYPPQREKYAYMEMWIPFIERENNS